MLTLLLPRLFSENHIYIEKRLVMSTNWGLESTYSRSWRIWNPMMLTAWLGPSHLVFIGLTWCHLTTLILNSCVKLPIHREFQQCWLIVLLNSSWDSCLTVRVFPQKAWRQQTQVVILSQLFHNQCSTSESVDCVWLSSHGRPLGHFSTRQTLPDP